MSKQILTGNQYNIVSNKEQFDDTKKKLLDQTKFELLEAFQIEKKLISRKDFSNEISKNRYENWIQKINNGIPWGEIKIWEKTIQINTKENKDILKEYEEIIQKKPFGYEKSLEALDTKLAERTILDNGLAIEFKSTEDFDEEKTWEIESKIAFENLNKIEKYKNKLEWITKKINEKNHFIIKWTEKELTVIEQKIKEIEQNKWTETWVPTLEKPTEITDTRNEAVRKLWNQLKNMNIGEITDLKMPDGKIIRLQKKDNQGWICLLNQVPEFNQYIDKNHFVEDGEGNKSYISHVRNKDLWKFLWIPEEQKLLPPHPEQKLLPPHREEHIPPVPIPIQEDGELDPVELTATISDTTKITRAIAERQAGEKLRKIYKNTARYKPRSRPTKLGLFLGRWYIKDHYTRKYMKMKWGMQRDENLVKGADRHEMEEANKFNEAIKNVGNIDKENYPRTYEAIDTLAKQITGNANTMPPRQRWIADNLFQDQFKAIIRRNLDTKKPTTATAINRKPLAQIMKDNDIQQMSSNITEKLNGFRDHQDMAWSIADRITRNPTESDASFNAFSRDKIIKYFNTYKKNPEFLKTMKIKLDDKNAMQELRRLQAHNWALTQIAAQTMRLKVQILAKGEEAYDVKQELTWFRWAMTKVGNRLDKPISDDSKLGKWMEKHPFTKNAFGMLRWATKLWAMITPAILLAPLGPLAVASWAGGMAFTKTLFKKYAHYNKEHIGYQRNQANNLLNNTAERNRLMDEMSKMNPASRFMLYYFGLGKKARDVRQFRDYVMTTHDQLENSNTLGSKIEWLLSKPQLTPQEQQELEKYISEWLARLDHHKKTGQNFLGSKDKDVSEKEYQNIYRLVLTGAMRLNKDLWDEKNPAAGTLRENNYYDNEMDLINNGTGDEVDQIGYQKSRKRFKHRQTEKALLGAVKAWGIAFGLSYLATSLASTKESTTTLSDTTSVKENFVLGGHESAGDNGVYTPAKTFFDASNTAGKNVSYPYGWGTDLVKVIPGHLTHAEYANKVTEVAKEINNMAINSTTKTNLLNELTKQPWLGVTWQENAVLHNMRCVEWIEQLAKALNDSTNAANIVITPSYAPDVYNIGATTYNNAGERVVQWMLWYSQTIITPAHTIPIPFPTHMNTFKEPDRYDEQSKPRRDEQGRKTRSPAPKVEKQTKKND